MSYHTEIEEPVAERGTIRITGVLKDETGAALAAASVSSLQGTLYDRRTKEIVNSREDVDLKNLNGGSIDADGNFAWTLGPDDNVIVNSGRSSEVHVALVEFTWAEPREIGTRRCLRWPTSAGCPEITPYGEGRMVNSSGRPNGFPSRSNRNW